MGYHEMSSLHPVEQVELLVLHPVSCGRNSEDTKSTCIEISNGSTSLCHTTYIFLISSTGICMQAMISGNSATMSLLLMVMLATIFLRAFFLAA